MREEMLMGDAEETVSIVECSELQLPPAEVAKHEKRSCDFWYCFIELLSDFYCLLPRERIRVVAPRTSTHPTFLLFNNQTNRLNFVVKFYLEKKSGESTYQTERMLFDLFKNTSGFEFCPHLVAEGCLRDLVPQKPEQKTAWRWPFIVMTAIHGSTLPKLIPQLQRRSNQISMLTQIAEKVKALREMKIPKTDISRFQPEFFAALLKRNKTRMIKKHQKKKTLPQRFLDQLDSYLPTDIDSFVKPAEYTFVHGDITDSNILAQVCESTEVSMAAVGTPPTPTHLHVPPPHEAGGGLQLCGIVDFGDGLLGDPLYEFITIHASLFHFDKMLLKRFLKLTGIPIRSGPEFAYRCMVYQLLNEFNRFYTSDLGFLIDWKRVPSLQHLANSIWNVDDLASMVPVMDAPMTPEVQLRRKKRGRRASLVFSNFSV